MKLVYIGMTFFCSALLFPSAGFSGNAGGSAHRAVDKPLSGQVIRSVLSSNNFALKAATAENGKQACQRAGSGDEEKYQCYPIFNNSNTDLKFTLTVFDDGHAYLKPGELTIYKWPAGSFMNPLSISVYNLSTGKIIYDGTIKSMTGLICDPEKCADWH